MRKIAFILLIFLSISFITGCATYKAMKHEYNKNKQGDTETTSELKALGEGLEKDFANIFVKPIENIFSGRAFRKDPD